MGPSLKKNLCLTFSTHLVLSHVLLFLQSFFLFNISITSINKLIWFYPLYSYVKPLIHIHSLNFQVQSYVQDIFNNSFKRLSQLKILYIPNDHYRRSKPYTHTICEGR